MRSVRRCVAGLLALAVVLSGTAAGARAQGDEARRLGAEVRIVAGDARLLAGPVPTAEERDGLRARLRGAFSALPLMLRSAGGLDAGEAEGRVAELRAALDAGRFGFLAQRADALSAAFPLDVRGIVPVPDPTPARLARGRAIHEAACAGCHDGGALGGPLPARDLFELAAMVTADEFAARLLLGMRGDALTSLANPFTDTDIGALMAFYSRN